jgi:hypothetical protein
VTAEQRLGEWDRQSGVRVTQAEWGFLAVVQQFARQGVGYGWMQQVIEWEWQAKCGPESAWGPEWFGRRATEAEGLVASLLSEAKRMYEFLLTTNMDREHPRMKALAAVVARAETPVRPNPDEGVRE